MYDEWNSQPVVINVATTGMEVGEVSFPSVTICSDGVLAHFSLASFLKELMKFESNEKSSNTSSSQTPFLMATSVHKMLNGAVIINIFFHD